jgi:hypothetical protein
VYRQLVTTLQRITYGVGNHRDVHHQHSVQRLGKAMLGMRPELGVVLERTHSRPVLDRRPYHHFSVKHDPVLHGSGNLGQLSH